MFLRILLTTVRNNIKHITMVGLTGASSISSAFLISGKTPLLQVNCAQSEKETNNEKVVKHRTDHTQAQPTLLKTPALPREPSTNDNGKQKQKNNSLWDNPAILLFSSVTVVALMYMMRSSFRGNTNAMLKGMQYRIVAQFLTFAACIVGAFIYTIKKTNENKKIENAATGTR